ncbi:unnamed protein product [Rotaria sp. Silwood1]|nr:unnamed protein product [Rotaria sp. Silwood1]CAF4872704.1 unnamed protein product [Rotaria sp. Silwood1]CAF4884541.1 unnamed protein product [Rotaria sp. Silwood1]CAF4893983.1 unnamed protein product [Rotaria sp. Silwood1]
MLAERIDSKLEIDASQSDANSLLIGLVDNILTMKLIQIFPNQLEEKVTYEMIIFNLNNDDNQSILRCPHPSFLKNDILENIKILLLDFNSRFILNFVFI